jgi:hypothetical protein
MCSQLAPLLSRGRFHHLQGIDCLAAEVVIDLVPLRASKLEHFPFSDYLEKRPSYFHWKARYYCSRSVLVSSSWLGYAHH